MGPKNYGVLGKCVKIPMDLGENVLPSFPQSLSQVQGEQRV